MSKVVLKAPYPWPGGKSRVADVVWDRLGNVMNFVEPFAGSAAVLLRRPADHFRDGYRVETLNDRNHFVANFFRAVTADPDRVAEFADAPVLEADLHARHKWLVRSEAAVDFRRRMTEDPDHFDAKAAGWWCWGACAWIGSGWCADGVNWEQMPELGSNYDIGKGVNGRPNLADAFDIGRGVNGSGGASCQMPLLRGDAGATGQGVNGAGKMPRLTGGRRGDEYYPGIGVSNIVGGAKTCDEMKRPAWSDKNGGGRGVNAAPSVRGDGADNRKRPDLCHELGVGCVSAPVNPTDGTCAARRAWLVDWMRRLADRLRLVRTCYGHWARVCDSDSTLARLGTTGAFLDPPYCLSVARMHAWVKHLRGDGPKPEARKGKAERADNLYATDRGTDLDHLVAEVHLWCVRWGGNPAVRVCVAGYEGEHNPLESLGWTKHSWEASGGYSNQSQKGGGKAANAKRERLWFSPGCLPTATLFDGHE